MQTVFISVIVLLTAFLGCGGDGPKPIPSNESIHPKLAVETPVEAKQPTTAEKETSDLQPEIQIPPQNPEADKLSAVNGEPKNVQAVEPMKTDKKKPVPPLTPLKTLTDEQSQRVCMRSCNKTHQCDFVRGSVALCVTRCMDSQKNSAERVAHQEARLFRAQSECADKACASFQPCVVKELLGAEALANAPPMSRDKTEDFCKALCGKQKECEPAYFSSIPGGMVTCIANCQQLAIRPDKTAASQRVIMNAAFRCVEAACGKEFENCAREKMTIPGSSGVSGHAP